MLKIEELIQELKETSCISQKKAEEYEMQQNKEKNKVAETSYAKAYIDIVNKVEDYSICPGIKYNIENPIDIYNNTLSNYPIKANIIITKERTQIIIPLYGEFRINSFNNPRLIRREETEVIKLDELYNEELINKILKQANIKTKKEETLINSRYIIIIQI